jgi:hypothetical protein
VLLVLALFAALAGVPAGSAATPAMAAMAAMPAATAGAEPVPSFLLEKITVTGNRRPASARIVVAESLLKEGQSYTEDDLRIAIRRIKRLPFIIEASFALRKGSERGRYELVVTVEETRPIFADIEKQQDVGGRFPIVSDLPFSQPNVDFGGDSLLGFREFVGSTGLAFATVGNAHSLSQLGYTRYDLFGDGSFASVALAYEPNGHRFTPALSAGVPLTVNQSLRATVSRVKSSESSGSFRFGFEDRTAELDWLYNTTDDPLFPTRGEEAQATLIGQSFDDRIGQLSGTVREGQHLGTLALSGHHHLPLTRRQSLTFGLTGSTYRYREFATVPEALNGPGPTYGYLATIEAGHAVDLWQGERARSWGDLRLETTASYGALSTARNLRNTDGPDPIYQFSLRTTLVYRSPWAVLRLGLVYSGKVMP